MNKEIEFIQNKLIESIDKLDIEEENVAQEISRANAIALLSNTYIKSCNLVIRVEELKNKEHIKNILGDKNEK